MERERGEKLEKLVREEHKQKEKSGKRKVVDIKSSSSIYKLRREKTTEE